MKLLIHNDGERLQGSERQLAILADGLARRGHHVVASVLAGGGLEQELRRRGVSTTRIRPKGDANIVAAARFWLFLRRERPDVMLCSSWPRLFWAAHAGRWAGVKRIVGRLGITRPAPDRWKYRAAFAQLDALIVNSAAVGETFLESAPWFSGSVHVVHNAAEPLSRPEPGALRRELGLGDEVRLLLSVGSLARRKGYDLLLEALAGVPGPHLAIAGQGPEGGALRGLAGRLGVSDRVHFLGRRDDVPALLADADLFVLATRRDSLPNAMLEAMAAEVPVLVSTVAGVEEALAPREGGPGAGWMVSPGDGAALRTALETAVRECRTVSGRRMAAEGARRAREWFGPERMVEGAEAVLTGEASADGERSSGVGASGAGGAVSLSTDGRES